MRKFPAFPGERHATPILATGNDCHICKADLDDVAHWQIENHRSKGRVETEFLCDACWAPFPPETAAEALENAR